MVMLRFVVNDKNSHWASTGLWGTGGQRIPQTFDHPFVGRMHNIGL